MQAPKSGTILCPICRWDRFDSSELSVPNGPRFHELRCRRCSHIELFEPSDPAQLTSRVDGTAEWRLIEV